MSEMRKRYFLRLAGRCIVLIICTCLYFTDPGIFDILNGMNFFKQFSPLHILWGLWVADMILQIIPLRNRLPIGSQKLFSLRFRPVRGTVNREALKKHMISTTKAAYKVFLLWCLLLGIIGFFYHKGIIGKGLLFLISVVFYVCDLICVLIWCPFRLMMHNRCCTTCRIFNWDHLMMFSPLIFMGGFYGMSLVLIAFAAWLVWEVCVLLYPERFWDQSNAALKCSECTDKLCTQYCQKLRR